jgi:hypothetical protein
MYSKFQVLSWAIFGSGSGGNYPNGSPNLLNMITPWLSFVVLYMCDLLLHLELGLGKESGRSCGILAVEEGVGGMDG